MLVVVLNSMSTSPPDLREARGESPGRNDRWCEYGAGIELGSWDRVVRDRVRLLARWLICDDFEKTASEIEIAAIIK
jgi:hypothetical protein